MSQLQMVIRQIADLDVDDDDTQHPAYRKSINFTTDKVAGSGSFGVVFQAQINNEVVAIKKVLQDRQFKNRELQVMKILDHPNCIKMKYFFYSTDSSSSSSSSKTFLNIVMDYVPQTIYSVCRYFTKQKKYIPHFYIKLYAYQLCRSITYIHGMGISHRDIKPQNILVDAASGVVRLCDFGSAKVLKPSEQSVAYICSRYYRAPELIFGATVYTCAIDVWSVGCVIAEMLLGQPLFPGESSVDQLVEIMKVIGKPTHSDMVAMNPMQYGPNASNRSHQSSSSSQQQMPPSVDGVLAEMPDIKPAGLSKILPSNVDRNAIDLLQRMLTYNPAKRIRAMECLAHPYFHSLSDTAMKMPDGRDMPPMFNFTSDELCTSPDFFIQLMQQHNGPNYNPVTNTTGTAPFQYQGVGAGGGGGGGSGGGSRSTSTISTPNGTAPTAQRSGGASRGGTGGSTARTKPQLPQLSVGHQGEQTNPNNSSGVFPAHFPSASSTTSIQGGQPPSSAVHNLSRISSQQSQGPAQQQGSFLPPLGNHGFPSASGGASTDLKKYAALPPIPPFRRNKNTSSASSGGGGSGQDRNSDNK